MQKIISIFQRNDDGAPIEQPEPEIEAACGEPETVQIRDAKDQNNGYLEEYQCGCIGNRGWRCPVHGAP